MKKKYITLMSFALSLSANIYAKGIDNSSIFHTLQQKQSLYLIERVKIQTDTVEKLAEETVNPEEPAASDSVKDNRQEWIDRYLSVSYPLNKIKITVNVPKMAYFSKRPIFRAFCFLTGVKKFSIPVNF